MTALEMLAKKVEKPEFAKAYRRNKVKAIEEVIGRSLSNHEQVGVKALTHTQLVQVIKALRPRRGGVYPPE